MKPEKNGSIAAALAVASAVMSISFAIEPAWLSSLNPTANQNHKTMSSRKPKESPLCDLCIERFDCIIQHVELSVVLRLGCSETRESGCEGDHICDECCEILADDRRC